MNRFALPRLATVALTLGLLSVLLSSPLVQAQNTFPLEQNKAVVRTFMEALYLKNDVDTAELLLSGDFLEHSPLEGEPSPVPQPPSATEKKPDPQVKLPVTFTLEKVIAEDDLVTTLLRVNEPGQPAYYFLDLFKVRGGLIVEHWDATEPAVQPTSSQGSGLKGKPSFFRKPKPPAPQGK